MERASDLLDERGRLVSLANVDGSGTATTVFAGEAGPCGVALDAAAGKVYWANFFSGEIRLATLDGSGTAVTLFTDIGGPVCGVAVDRAAGKIYWANFNANSIRVANLDGSGVAATLFQEGQASGPSGVAIDAGRTTGPIRSATKCGWGIWTAPARPLRCLVQRTRPTIRSGWRSIPWPARCTGRLACPMRSASGTSMALEPRPFSPVKTTRAGLLSTPRPESSTGGLSRLARSAAEAWTVPGRKRSSGVRACRSSRAAPRSGGRCAGP